MCASNWIATCRRMKLGPYFSPCTKINSQLFKSLNLRAETLIGKTLQDSDIGKDYGCS